MSMPRIGFHSGEPAVQRRAGVEAQASRLSRMVGPGELRGGVAALLEVAPFAAITARDRNGRLWISPLTGPRGFLAARTPTTLAITSELPGTDPLHGLEMGQPVGVVVMDFAAKRRARINGTLTATDRDVLEVDVAQAYGNCPQYIRPRRLDSENQSAAADFVVHRGESMDDDDVEPVGSADTFFLGIAHPEHSNDASRRGGPAGLVSARRPLQRGVAGLCRQQPVQQLRQSRGRPDGSAAVRRVRDRTFAAPLGPCNAAVEHRQRRHQALGGGDGSGG